MNSDRNLLFGVLALQTDLIDASQFADACAACATRKNIALADILVERGWITAGDRADVDRLLERKLRRRGGDLLATIEAAADAGVRQALLTVEDSEFSRTIARLSSVGGHVLVDAMARPSESHTRYTLTRLQGQGGLGRVWVARDNDLNREVALKELHAEAAEDPVARSRFLKEAQITGQLEHPNIVPVYELGHRADDKTFYTMRFLRGETLRHAILEYHKRRRAGADDSLEMRRLLGAFVGVCHALAYAHSRGVVHRDVKPSNIALGHFGEVVLLDWGLAKIATASDESSATLALPAAGQSETQAGRALGTPSYMAPEQALGQLDRIGPATDIYGLGATLFELLTGRAPHKGDDTAQTLDHIVKGPTPRARAINPSVPPALDAIAAKSMAKEPADRYATVSDLADDIQRWLADEPVSVHRDPPLDRAARWARRHRAWTQAAAAALVLVSTVSIAAAVVVQRARASELGAHEETERALAAQTRANSEATQYFREARGAVDGYLATVNDVLKHFDQMQGARVRLLRKAAEDYERFAHLQSDRVELRAEFARAMFRLGDIHRALGEVDEAAKAYQSAETFYATLIAARREDLSFIAERANCRIARGNLFRDTGKNEDAERAYRATIDELREFVSKHSESPEIGASFAMSLVNLSLLEHALGRHAVARTTIRDAIDRYQRLTKANPTQHRLHFDLAGALISLGQMERFDGEIDRAVTTLGEAARLLSQLVRQHPEEEPYRQSLADSRIAVAAVLRTQGDAAAERAEYESAISDYAILSKGFPDSPLYRANVAMTQSDLGQLLKELGENVAAKRVLVAAKQVFEELATENVSHVEALASVQSDLGEVLANLGENAEAEAELAAAIDSFTGLVARYEPAQYRERLAVSLSRFGHVLHKQKRFAEARDAFDNAHRHFQTLLKADEKPPQYRDEFAWSLTRMGDLLRDMEKLDEAKAVHRQAVDLRVALAQEFSAAKYQHDLAWLLATSTDESLRDAARALSAAKAACDRTPQSAAYWTCVGVAHFRCGDFGESIRALDRAAKLRGTGHCLDWFFLAMANQRAGETEVAEKCFNDAVEWMSKNVPDNLEIARIHSEARHCLGR